MLQRNCAGGVVFYADKVLVLRNDKGEWVLPKGLIPAGALSYQVAAERVKVEAGVAPVEIICPAGETRYEFYSMTRRSPVCNHITWYVMTAESDCCTYDTSLGFTGGGFFAIEKALDLITYSQDKMLVKLAHEKLNDEESDLQAP